MWSQSKYVCIVRCLSGGSGHLHHAEVDPNAREESLTTDGVNEAERKAILQIVKLKEHVKVIILYSGLSRPNKFFCNLML